MDKEYPQVVLLGLVDTGYGMVRSLAAKRVSVIAFEWYNQRFIPENKTSLCEKKYFHNEQDLLIKLINLADSLKHKPALFMSSDMMVKFVSENRQHLMDRFLINFPGKPVVDLLLEKTLFTKYAVENGFLIPRTIIVEADTNINKYYSNIPLPCIVKPYWRRENWGKAHFPKVFF